MKAIFTQYEGSKRYEVFYDEEDFDDFLEGLNCIEFDSEQDKEEYMSKLETGELSAFIVTESVLCDCCGEYRQKDSIGGIHAETRESALAYYLDEVKE